MEVIKNFPAMHLVCGTDDLRPIMQNVLLTKDLFIATNAHIMVWHDTKQYFDEDIIENIPDKGLLIHKEDWIKLKGASFLFMEGEFLKIIYPRKQRATYIKVEANDSEFGKFPNWKGVVPEANNVELSKIALDPELLVKAKKAIGTGKENVLMHFNGMNRAILLTSQDSENNSYMNASGIIMPVKFHAIEDYKPKHRTLAKVS